MSEEKQEVEKPADDERWAGFLAGIDKLNESVSALHETVRQPPTSVAPPAKQEPDEIVFPADWDDWTDKQKYIWMVQASGQRIVGKVSEIVQPALNRQQQAEVDIAAERYTREIEGILSQKDDKGNLSYPDFGEWNDEMLALAQETEGMTPMRLYKLAREENPMKRAALDKKYAPKLPEPVKKPFSLSPYGSGDAGGPGATTKHKTSGEAFQAALSKVKDRWPGVFDNLGT